MSSPDNLQGSNPQEPIHQPVHPEKKKARPPWVNALIIVGVLTIFVLWFALVAYLAIGVFHERSSAEFTEMTEVQEESPVDESEIVTTRPESIDWDIEFAALVDVMRQNHVAPSRPWGPENSLRFSSFTVDRDTQGVHLIEFESNEAAAYWFEIGWNHFPEYTIERDNPIVFAESALEFPGAGNVDSTRVTVILFENYVFDVYVEARYHYRHIEPLIDRLGYRTMTVVPEDPIEEFREAILALNLFGTYDSGYIQNAVFHNSIVTVSLYEKFDDSGKEGFLERIMARDPAEYQIVEDGSHVHFWAIEYWGGSDNMYLVSIYHQNFLYEFISNVEHREAIDRIVSQLGF